MRCTCQNCGTYMVQDEKGLSSRCICPNCFHTCNACMGTPVGPLTVEQLKSVAMERLNEERVQRQSDDAQPAGPGDFTD